MPKGTHELLAELLDLPATEIRDVAQLFNRPRPFSSDSLEALATAQYPGIEVESAGRRVTNGLEPRDDVIEVGIALPSLRAGEARQLALVNRQSSLHRFQNVRGPRLEDSARHALHGAQLTSRGRCETRDVEQSLVADDAERSAVQRTGDVVAPGHELTQQG